MQTSITPAEGMRVEIVDCDSGERIDTGTIRRHLENIDTILVDRDGSLSRTTRSFQFWHLERIAGYYCEDFDGKLCRINPI